MAMYCLNMLKIALELASKVDPIYEDIASKFLEHFLYIANAMNDMGSGRSVGRSRRLFLRRSSFPGKPRSPCACAPSLA